MNYLCFASSLPIGRPASKLSCKTPIRSNAPKVNMVAQDRFPGEYDAIVGSPKTASVSPSEVIANDLATGPLESQCGGTWDSQQVETYDGTLGVTRKFVDDHQRPVGNIRWRDDLASRYKNPGNVSGKRWCSGTLISDEIFLTAGHCFHFNGASGWVYPTRDDGSTIPDTELARELLVEFEYQRDAQGNLRTPIAYPIEALIVEPTGANLDYAVIRLGRTRNQLPGHVYGTTPVSEESPAVGDMCCIIGHPDGRPKSIEAGKVDQVSQTRLKYGDIDTLGGSSGSGVLRQSSADIVGVHTNGGCGVTSGYNSGVKTSYIIAHSPLVKDISNRPRWSSVMEVPGPFGAIDQGGGIAFASLSGNTTTDLVAMHLERSGAQNTASYRVGKNLQELPDGNFKFEKWTNAVSIPMSGSDSNAGGGIAISNIKSQTSNDIVVFHIANPLIGVDHGYYKVGFSLDSDGNPAGGWSNDIEVPGGFGINNQGGDVTVASIKNASSKDLVVMNLEDLSRDNKGHYRIGFDLGPDGKARGGWSKVMDVPGWFGWESQGGSVEVFDTNGNGKLDIVIFHIDNPKTNNRGYYRIGSDLNDKGEVTGGWSKVVEVPGWFGWETQGAGIAMKTLNGTEPTMGVFHIDNPSSENHGYVRFGTGSFDI